ncbi:PDR/VanB family oxidoreductase [Streptomyces sp. NPDC050504]|uniref:PDR/VanB family oxidoreductase n=1 Tax=Streptomyces sp. NPDC050504 TaxID=3365618 RepID=UPI0037BA7BA0
MTAEQELLVQETRQEADGVLGLLLTHPEGAELPAWEPGAHLELTLPSGLVRHYSLSGDPADRSVYRLGVLRVPDGRGGSAELHDTDLTGRRLTVRGPINRFPLAPAERYLFIAGGIGITPLLPMVRQVAADPDAAPWSLVYGGRCLTSMAYRDELADLPGDAVTFVPQDTDGCPNLDLLLKDLAPGTAVYTCGPEGLLRAVEERCERWLPPGTLNLERFGAGPKPEKPAVPDGAFEVALSRTGKTLLVPPDRTLLEVVREAVPKVASGCEEGFCGTCETKVLGGEPEHNDTVLTDDDRASNTTMMICVGRSKGGLLTLDL